MTEVCQSCTVTVRATLFDMDGLLIDSEILWHRAEVEIFGTLGVALGANDARATKGMFVAEVVEYWYARTAWTGPTRNEVVDRLLVRVGELVEREGRLLPGALRALQLAGERGPLALASSTPLELITRCLDHFNLRAYFSAVHSAEFEPYGKPHPGVFLTAASLLTIEPTACLVLEDSPAGVLAGASARMRVVAVPALEDRAEPAFGLADLVLGSLDDLTPAWLDEAFGR